MYLGAQEAREVSGSEKEGHTRTFSLESGQPTKVQNLKLPFTNKKTLYNLLNSSEPWFSYL